MAFPNQMAESLAMERSPKGQVQPKKVEGMSSVSTIFHPVKVMWQEIGLDEARNQYGMVQ